MYKIIIEGNCTSATCFSVSESIDIITSNQIKVICDNSIFKDCKIAMMPDMHPGKVGPIGLTIKMDNNKPLMPALIGNDIGCGMTCIKFKPKHKLTSSDFNKLNKLLLTKPNKLYNFSDEIYNNKFIDHNKAKNNFCTIGGGNHFIEIDQDEKENYYLVIHTGSRSVGNDVYEYYMREGNKLLTNVPYENTYLAGTLKSDYLDSVKIASEYATDNRYSIAMHIISSMKWNDFDYKIDVPHNYIDASSPDFMIIHKGSISSLENQDVVIPINMRDGIILGKGKSNSDWNYSAPHGSGRLIKRSDISNSITMNMYKKSMEGIYSPSINRSTLDESPFAYRDLKSIKEAISDTVEITNILKPVYNFKNGGY